MVIEEKITGIKNSKSKKNGLFAALLLLILSANFSRLGAQPNIKTAAPDDPNFALAHVLF